MFSNSFVFNIYPILTPQVCKRLGINKSTLWYMQKQIRKGERIKVYRKVMNK